jgi:polar amino acid transport system permease protein
LMKEANTAGISGFNYFQAFILAGIIYAVIAVPATWITSYFERRMARKY